MRKENTEDIREWLQYHRCALPSIKALACSVLQVAIAPGLRARLFVHCVRSATYILPLQSALILATRCLLTLGAPT
jgi:hypothetical protein